MLVVSLTVARAFVAHKLAILAVKLITNLSQSQPNYELNLDDDISRNIIMCSNNITILVHQTLWPSQT